MQTYSVVETETGFVGRYSIGDPMRTDMPKALASVFGSWDDTQKVADEVNGWVSEVCA